MAGQHTMGQWHTTGGRARDGAGQHARVRWWSHTMGTATCQCGWGHVGPGWGRVGEGEGRVRAGHGSVVGGRCILMGLRRHVHGVVSAGASGKERAWAASKRTGWKLSMCGKN